MKPTEIGRTVGVAEKTGEAACGGKAVRKNSNSRPTAFLIFYLNSQ